MKLSPTLITTALGIAGALGVLAWWMAPGPVAEPAVAVKNSVVPPSLSRQEIKSAQLPYNGSQATQHDESPFEPGMPISQPLQATANTGIPQPPPISLPTPPAPANVNVNANANTPQTPRTLAERASQVQQQANRELERLVPLLNLTDEQQDRVFARLAQNSVFWTPELTTDVAANPKTGSASQTTPTAIPEQTKSIPDLLLSTPEGETPILDPEQEIAIAQDQLDRQSWWEEVLGNIQQDLKNGTSTTSATTTAAAAAAPPPDPERDLSTDPIIKTEQGADTVVD